QDELRAVDDRQLQLFLQVAQLERRKIVVDDDQVCVFGNRLLSQLLHLPLAEVADRVGVLAPLGQRPDGLAAGRTQTSVQLLQLVLEVAVPALDCYQQRSLTASRGRFRDAR